MKTITQQVAVPAILEVGKGNLEKVGSLLAKTLFRNIVIFFGEGIYQLFGEKIIASIEHEKIKILRQLEYPYNDSDQLLSFAFEIPAETQLVVGVGGGKILDIAKYVSFLNDLPFVSIPTATSNDGFASSGCSLMIGGRRRSIHAQMPYGIIVDLDVIKHAPESMIYSGVGDLISKITAVYDWQFEEAHGKAEVNDFAAMIAKKSVNSIARMEIRKDIHDDFFLKELVDSLTMSGISMEIAGNSAPASGSEHLISHYLDSFAEKPQLHGLQVGVATYLMSLVQNHRSERVEKFLVETGFFKFVKGLGMKASDFESAIDHAYTIKPYRYTYLHVAEARIRAKELIYTDSILKEILR